VNAGIVFFGGEPLLRRDLVERAGSPRPASEPARAEVRQAATDVLQRLADGPALDRGLAATIARLADDPDPRVRALASYLLWRAERGR
jgi:hypothetical protein